MKFRVSPQIAQVHFPPISEVRGWLVGRNFPAERPLIDLCQPRITQQAVRFGCDHLDAWVMANNAMMQRCHDLFRKEFRRPGNPFGPGLEPYLRLVFGNLPEAQVPAAVARFRELGDR